MGEQFPLDLPISSASTATAPNKDTNNLASLLLRSSIDCAATRIERMSLPKRLPPVSGHTRHEGGQRSASLASTPLIPEQFKEAFSLLDKNGDGQITKTELAAMWTSLGMPKSDGELDAMLAELPSPLSFAAYFTAMTSMLTDMSTRDDLMAALMTFDEDDCGKIDVAELKEALTTGKGALTHNEVDQVLHGNARNGKFNYNAFVESIAGAA